MDTQSQEREKLSITSAGLRLRRSYNQVQRLLLVGSLRGGRDDDGRFWIDGASVTELERRAAPVEAA